MLIQMEMLMEMEMIMEMGGLRSVVIPCIRQDLFCKAGDIYQDIDTFYSLLFPNAKVGNKMIKNI